MHFSLAQSPLLLFSRFLALLYRVLLHNTDQADDFTDRPKLLL